MADILFFCLTDPRAVIILSNVLTLADGRVIKSFTLELMCGGILNNVILGGVLNQPDKQIQRKPTKWHMITRSPL